MNDITRSDDHEPEVEGFIVDGIGRLIYVSQATAARANEQALAGVAKQQALIEQQKKIRAAQATYSSYMYTPTIKWRRW